MLTITIRAPAKGEARVRVDDPDEILRGKDLSPVRQLMIQALCSIEGEAGTIDRVDMPVIALNLLRNFLNSIGGTDKGKARRLLLMALIQLDDEDESLRFVKPIENLPLIT